MSKEIEGLNIELQFLEEKLNEAISKNDMERVECIKEKIVNLKRDIEMQYALEYEMERGRR